MSYQEKYRHAAPGLSTEDLRTCSGPRLRIRGRTFTDPDDAAVEDRVQTEGPGPGDDPGTVGTRIQPDLPDSLPRDLVDDPFTDRRLEIAGWR